MILLWILPLLVLQVWACTLPIFGHFGSYQAVNAMMAEMFGNAGVRSFFEPRVFSISDGQPALHLLYVPYGAWFARLTQLGLRLSPDTIPFLGKLCSLLTGLGCAWVIRCLVRRIYQRSRIADLAAFLFLITPMISVVSVSFQNETWALFFMLCGLLFLLRGCEVNAKKMIFAAGFFLGLAVTARIHFAFFLLPAFWILAKYQTCRRIGFLSYLTGFLLPIMVWVGWFYFLEKTESGVLTSLFSQSGEGRIATAAYFKNPSFYWRLIQQFLLYWTFPMGWLLMGAIIRQKGRRFLWVWLLASFSVVLLLPRKVFDHPFYLVGGIPAFCVLAAPVIDEYLSRYSRRIQAMLAGGIILVTSVIFVRFQTIPAESGLWLNQAEIIRRQTQREDKVVIQHDQGAAMLFYTHRLGWGFDVNMAQSDILSSQETRHQVARANGYGNLISWIEYLRSQGARWFIVTNIDKFEAKKLFATYMHSRYSLHQTNLNSIYIFDLRGAL